MSHMSTLALCLNHYVELGQSHLKSHLLSWGMRLVMAMALIDQQLGLEPNQI